MFDQLFHLTIIAALAGLALTFISLGVAAFRLVFLG
jgi:hypothetical protein